MLREADEWLNQKTTEAYLWLLDWTGAYVGTVMLVVWVADALFTYSVIEVSTTKKAIDAGLIVWVCGGYWHRQRRGVKNFNAESLWWRASTVRVILILLSTSGMFVGASTGDWRRIAWWFPVVLVIYLMGVLIRDREPKELGRKLAMEGSR